MWTLLNKGEEHAHAADNTKPDGTASRQTKKKGKYETMKRALAMILCVLMVMSLAACGSKDTPQNQTPEPSKEDNSGNTSTTGTYLDTLTPPSNKRALCLGTGSSSGVWYILGGGIANAINLNSKWFTVTNEAASGGGENLRNLQDENIDIAMLNCDMGYYYYTSTDTYEGAGSDQLRSLFAMPASAMHIVTRAGSGINSVADLKGKRIAVGLAGSGYESFASKVIANAGLTYDDMTVQMINPSQMSEALQNDQVDAFFFPVQLPSSAITELALNTDLSIVPLDDAFVDKYQSTYVGYVTYTIPAGTYKNQTEDIQTLATGQFVATLADTLSEDEAYVLMCDIFDNRDEWLSAHNTAQEVTVDNIGSLIVPMHAGAYKFYVERGVDVPEALIPPEAK